MMRRVSGFVLVILLGRGTALGAGKPHVIGFGKSVSVKWLVGADENQALEIKVRGLYIDGRLKEFTIGPAHDVTDHFFVVRRAFHLNDALPQDGSLSPKWGWQRGGWLLVDRVLGHISQLPLAEFDTYYSTSSWYRDYVAYCGISDDGKKIFAVVAQIGRRKPIFRKAFEEVQASSDGGKSQTDDMPDSECTAPTWQRQPARVTFVVTGQSFTYSIHRRDAEAVIPGDESDGSE